jgi:hypothetical protein
MAIVDNDAASISLPKPDRFTFVITRRNPPRGYKIKTPFGLCDIANCQEKPDGFQTVFWVTRDQVLNLIKKLDKETP